MNGGTEMDVREKLVELLSEKCMETCKQRKGYVCSVEECKRSKEKCCGFYADHLISNGVTVQEWINSEEMLPEFPCLAIDVNGNSVFIPDGILTIKDKHGEWCINASLAKEVRLIDGTKMDALIWENRIAYWMPLPKLPQPPKGE